jgi:hypothetical protein
MRLVSTVLGAAAVHVSPDDVAPDRTVVARELIEEIKDRYSFSVAPTPPPVGAQPSIIVFQDGALILNESRISISQLFLFPDGDAVVAKHTDEANTILDDLIAFLVEKFGFRYRSATLDRLNTSNVVVDLDQSFTTETPTFSVVGNLIDEILGTKNKYYLKRLAFGIDSSVSPQSATSVKQFIGSDFMIEARANFPLGSNRFFSSAPLSTNDHVQYLERLEKAAIEKTRDVG